MAATASTSIPKGAFLTAVAVYAALDGLLLVYSVRHGSWLGAVVAALLASTVPIALLAQFYEAPRMGQSRTLGYLISHFQDQSYAFLFGDLLFLPFAAAMAALAWKNTPALKGTSATSWWWTGISVVVGLLAAYWFRYLNDKAAYYKAGAIGSFNAPTKLLHDFGAYPVLFGGLFCVGVPLFLKAVNGHAPFFLFYATPYMWLVLMGIGLWFAAGLVHDAGLFGPPLDPRKLHPDNWVWLAAAHLRS